MEKKAVRTKKKQEDVEDGAIYYPEGKVTDWHGHPCCNFEVDGAEAFIVAPKNGAAPGRPWLWCLSWPEAFWPQLPAATLLDMGWHYVYLDCPSHRMNPEGIRHGEKFYAMLQELHFAPKGALMGMSRGGFFSLRWASEHPETVSCIYLDAPVCELNAYSAACYGIKDEKDFATHPLSPVNNVAPLVKAKIPMLLLRHGQDQTAKPADNSDLFTERLRAAGGEIQIMDLEFYGHHPHGLYDPKPLVDFILQHR